MFRKLCVLAAFFMANVAVAAVDVNKASAADLDGLSGVGPATTQLILNERKKAEFKNWEDLMKRVKGIGESRASKLSEAGLTVSGASYSKGKAKGKTVNAPDKASTERASANNTAAAAKPVMTPAAVVPALNQPATEKKPAEKSAEKGQQAKKVTEAASGSR